MINQEKLEQLAQEGQTNFDNIFREYCQHLFLSFLYQKPDSEKILFKGGTALRIIYASPRFSEDLDFTGINISQREIENLITKTLESIEKMALEVDILESKTTSGGYLGIINFSGYNKRSRIQIEISLRNGKNVVGERMLIQSNYLPAYTIIQLPIKKLIAEKIAALFTRTKPRDFFDYYFLLTGNYPLVKEKENLEQILKLLKQSKINFRVEFRKFLPISHYQHLRSFSDILKQKIENFLL